MNKKEEKIVYTATEDTKEAWKQMAEDSDFEPLTVTFEALDLNKDKKAATLVNVNVPEVTTNYQYASLFSAIFKHIASFIDDIDTMKELEDKMAPIDEIRTGSMMLSIKLLSKAKEIAQKEGIDTEEDEEEEDEDE